MIRRLLLACLLSGCSRPGEPTLEPGSGSMTGYYEVRVDLAETRIDPSDVTGVDLAGLPAYDLRIDGDEVVCTIQGAAESGPAQLVVHAGPDVERFDGAFVFDPPAEPLFERMYGVGASLTQGVQAGVPTRHGQLNGPAFQLADRAGAFFALPLLDEGLFPTIDPEDIGPAPDCKVPDVVGFIASAAVEVLGKLNDPKADRLDFSLARTTPTVEPRNLAVGGSKITTLVDGPGDDFATAFIAKLVYDVYADVTDPVDTSQLDLVEAGRPTMILATDAYGNDLITAVAEGNGIDTSRLTDEDVFRAKLSEFIDRTAATGAQVFISNMARATLLPVTDEKVRSAVAAAELSAEQSGQDPVAAGEAEEALQLERVAEVEERGALFNDILAELAEGHPNVHVVDFSGLVEQVEAEGVQIGDQTLTIEKFGGLLSTDGVHFSDVGYAMVANLFLDTIETEVGVSVPRIDLQTILTQDPFSPASFAGSGLDVEACSPR